MEDIQQALGALFLMAGVVTIVYIIARYSYLIKKAMIEKGLTSPETSKKMQYLDIGCIIIYYFNIALTYKYIMVGPNHILFDILLIELDLLFGQIYE